MSPSVHESLLMDDAGQHPEHEKPSHIDLTCRLQSLVERISKVKQDEEVVQATYKRTKSALEEVEIRYRTARAAETEAHKKLLKARERWQRLQASVDEALDKL